MFVGRSQWVKTLFSCLSCLTQERGVVPSLIPAEVVVQALVQDQPLAVDQTDYNLDIKASNTHLLRIEANIHR